jgi:protein-L-isoaspartate(D-aspartate) O-methyltransferase
VVRPVRWRGIGGAAAAVAAVVATAAMAGPAEKKDPFVSERESMVRRDIAARGVEDERTLAAMREVPRHDFVPDSLQRSAYADQPLPIGHGQTISQPYIVAAMTELLELKGGESVLEIGTGSGYQAAILARVARQVYSIEIVRELGEAASARLTRLGITNVEVRVGDGYFGWDEHAPFDAIVVTAAASHIPPPLVEQLRAGGRMVIPLGPPMAVQNLMLVEKMEDGTTRQRDVMPVRFVPLTGGR